MDQTAWLVEGHQRLSSCVTSEKHILLHLSNCQHFLRAFIFHQFNQTVSPSSLAITSCIRISTCAVFKNSFKKYSIFRTWVIQCFTSSSLFGLFWLSEVYWWAKTPERYLNRAVWLEWASRSVFLFMVVNGAVIFVNTQQRWLGIALVLVIVTTWWPTKNRLP